MPRDAIQVAGDWLTSFLEMHFEMTLRLTRSQLSLTFPTAPATLPVSPFQILRYECPDAHSFSGSGRATG